MFLQDLDLMWDALVSEKSAPSFCPLAKLCIKYLDLALCLVAPSGIYFAKNAIRIGRELVDERLPKGSCGSSQ